MILQETYTLNNGLKIPKLALGTWMIDDNKTEQAVQDAIQIGYRHIDTAQAYQNEAGVGRGIKASGIKREDLFITTKLAAEIKSYDGAVAAIEESLQKLGLDYIDLMIIHSPQPWNDFRGGAYAEGNREAWKALEEAYTAGKLRAIGVSNFLIEDLNSILDNCSIKPMVNQVLAHIGKTPTALIEYNKDNDILTQAYSPIGHGVLLNHDVVVEMAKKYSVTVPQLAIRYCLELKLLPLPKTSSPDHMRSNANVNFTISDEDMEILKAVETITDYGDANIMPVFSAT